jgi:hypothetical protein
MEEINPLELIPKKTYYLKYKIGSLETEDPKYSYFFRGKFHKYFTSDRTTGAAFKDIVYANNTELHPNIQQHISNGIFIFSVSHGRPVYKIYKYKVLEDIKNKMPKIESLQSLAFKEIPLDSLKKIQGNFLYNSVYLREHDKRPNPIILNGMPSEEDLKDRIGKGRRRRKTFKSRKSRKTKSRRR